ncbi:MAG: alpha-2-macroglobulin family protein, partial [Chloroflexota bacterium]
MLSSWTVDGTDVPENALRFDLLEFDSNFGISRCPTSLPTRLLGAQEAVVISSPDPVRARQAPSTGAIVDLLYVDYQLTIAGDPVCGEEGLMWYPVELGDGTTAYVAESSEDEYLIAPPEGSNTTELQVADENGEGLDPGIYYLRIDPRGTRGYNQGHLMVVANVNLTVKHTRDSMFVWATDVQTGEPVANLPVSFYGDNGEFDEIGSGITDEMGVLFLDVPIDESNNRRLAIVDDEATGYFGIGYSQWDSGISPWSFGQSYDYYPDDYTVYMYSDRPVYRPGQPVYIRGIVRSQDDISFTPPDIDDIYMYVANGFGDTIFEGNVDVNEFGTFSLELDLAEDTQLGYYSAIAEAPISEGNYWPPRGRIRFNVAEYRLPEFLVDVTPNTPEVVQGDTLSVTVDSTYFFGGSVSNATVEYSVVSTSYFFRYEGSRRYDFIDYNYDSGPSAFFATNDSGAIATGSATTDANGEFVIELPAELADASQSQTFTVEATVRDDTGQSVSGRGEVVVHQGEVYVGLRSENYVIRTGEESAINFVTVDWDSQPVANQTVDYEVVERRWSSVQERDELGRTIWTYEVEEIPITDGQITTDANGEAQFLFTPETGGSYKIYATTRDENGNEVRSSTFVWVSSSTYVSWRQQNSNRIDLVSDAESYTVGDTAEILITSPFQGTAEALITVERGDILTYDHVTMDSNSLVYELPIDASYAPNIYVSVMIVKGVDDTNPVAAFRMGYIQFSVDPEQQQLNIDISSNVDRTSPQETVTYTVRTTDYQGNPVSAEVGVGVTDLAALSLAPDNSRPIFNHFYSDQRLAVRTTTPLTINTDQITQEVLDTVKGGGGGIVADGLIEIRGEFIDTPYWNPSIVTDENGEATFDVRLPDNLTTWRLDARAITLSEDGNLLVGQNTFDLLSTKPLLIRPVTPRFFVVDDEVVLAAVVNNNTESDQEAVVTLNYTGVTLLEDNASQVVSVPADSSVRVTWRVTVDDVETAQLSFVADAGNFTDGAVSGVSQDQDGTLPIYRYAPPEIGDVVGTAGVIDSADSRIETIYLPERMNIEEGTLTVQLEQSLAATTNDSLNYLSYRYHRYYYTTSIVSRFLPNIMSYRALESFDLVNSTLEENLETNVLLGIQSLTASQRPDGGWGWSPRSDSDPMTTAYVVLGLHEAREQGF